MEYSECFLILDGDWLNNLTDYSTLISTPCLSGVNCVEVCYS